MFKHKLLTAVTAAALGLGFAGTAMAQDTRPFDPARDNYNYDFAGDTVTLTGTVTSIRGLNVLTLSDAGAVNVDLLEMPYNPTSPNYDPRVEVGDTVTFRGIIDGNNQITAREIVSVQKSWQAEPTYGQTLNMVAPAAGGQNDPNARLLND